MSAARVRWATADDASGVAAVHVDAWRDAYRGLIPQEVLDGLDVDARTALWTGWLAASLAGEPTDPGRRVSHRLLVAEIDGAIVGWAGFGAGRDEGTQHLGELAGLYVHPRFWSQRVGHALIVRAEQELAGYDEAYLWVLHGNERAARFYEAHGWLEDGTGKVADAGSARDLREVRRVRRLGS